MIFQTGGFDKARDPRFGHVAEGPLLVGHTFGCLLQGKYSISHPSIPEEAKNAPLKLGYEEEWQDPLL